MIKNVCLYFLIVLFTLKFAEQMKEFMWKNGRYEAKVVSGGFIENINGTLSTVGKSISLRVDSRPEDIKLLYI